MTKKKIDMDDGTWEVVRKLESDKRKASARLMDRREIRFLLDLYYAIQDFRKANASRIASLEAGEPGEFLQWGFDLFNIGEKNVKLAINEFTEEYTVSKWMKSIRGIGPMISAGFIARLDIRIGKLATKFYRYAGQDPTSKWKRGEKCPWNPMLKKLCFLAADCLDKTKNLEDSFYGPYMIKWKKEEIEKNEAGLFASQAAAQLQEKNYRKTTEAYKHYIKGRLPPAHIVKRVYRRTNKILLSHIHHAMYEDYYGTSPPIPYAFTEHCTGNHMDYIPPPNWPFPDKGKSLKELFRE